MIIPVITLYQPWASWIMIGWKTIETRTHNRFQCLLGKRIGIHASYTFDRSIFVTKNKYLSREQMLEFERDAYSDIVYPTGVFLGTIMVDSVGKLSDYHSRQALIDCQSIKRFGLFLSNPLLKEYIEVIGSMGIWYFDTEKGIKVHKPIMV